MLVACKGAVECTTSETPKHDDQHMPNLSKYSKQQKAKFKRRLMALEKTKATHGKNAETIRRREIRK